MDILDRIKQLEIIYGDEPRPMVQESRNMYADGQLVQPNIDGSRPGYSGKESTTKLRKYLSTLDPKTKVQPMALSKKFDVARKHVYTILKEYPKIKTLGKKEAFKLVQDKTKAKILETPVDVPTPVSKLRKLGGNTRDYTSVRWPNDEVKNNYIKDFKQKRSGTKAGKSGLSNEKLAKKYFGKINTSTISSVERTNRVLQQELDLQYQEGDPKEFQIKRKKRLKKTADFTAGGTDDFPFHHIRQIGGEVPLTTDDIAVINKKMNSKIAPYNKPLNAIADAISDNITYSFEAMQSKQEGKALDYLKRVDELNNNAESIVKKAVKDLPKEYKNLIGFNKFYARTDEYGFPLDDKVRVEKIGGTKTTTGAIPLNDLTKDQASILRKQIKTDATAGKNINQKQILSQLEKLGCGKSAGGRIMFGEGTSCAIKGKKILAEGLKIGFKKGEQAMLATAILKAGKSLKDITSLRALIGPAAVGFIAAEQAAYVGYDVLSKGKSFKEAIGDSAFNYLLGDKTKVNEKKERNKRMIEEGMTSEQMGKIGNLESQSDRIIYGNSLLNKIKDAKQGQLDEMSNDPSIDYLPNRTDEFKKQEDDARTNLREFYRGDTNFTADQEGAQKALAEGLRRNELAQLRSVDNIFQSRKGDFNRNARISDLMLEKKREAMQNPDVLNYMGQYPTTLGFAGGGIAGLSGRDKSGPAPTGGPLSQGLFSLRNNGKKR